MISQPWEDVTLYESRKFCERVRFQTCSNLACNQCEPPGVGPGSLAMGPRLHNAAYGSASQHPSVTLMGHEIYVPNCRFSTRAQQMRDATSRVVRPQAADWTKTVSAAAEKKPAQAKPGRGTVENSEHKWLEQRPRLAIPGTRAKSLPWRKRSGRAVQPRLCFPADGRSSCCLGA